MRMPTEFQETITVGLHFPCQSDRCHRPFPVAHVAAADGGLQQPAPQRFGEHSQVAHCIYSPLLPHSFADAIQAGPFLYTAYKEKMTGIGWMSLGTDWNTMQTYAGLSEEFRQPVMEAMVVKWIR